MEIDRHKTPAPGCIDAPWCALDCEECWRQYDERKKSEDFELSLEKHQPFLD